MTPTRRCAPTLAVVVFGCLAAGCGSNLPDPQPMPAGKSFSGMWDTNWGQLTLRQTGKRCFGQYKGFRNGSVSGDVKGNLFIFRWNQIKPRMWGRGYLQMMRGGDRLEGRWGYMKDRHEGGRWWANRVKRQN